MNPSSQARPIPSFVGLTLLFYLFISAFVSTFPLPKSVGSPSDFAKVWGKVWDVFLKE